MINYLTELLSGMQNWGYVIVFVIVVLECQAFLGLFMPGESLVVLTGFLAAQQVLNLQLLDSRHRSGGDHWRHHRL